MHSCLQAMVIMYASLLLVAQPGGQRLTYRAAGRITIYGLLQYSNSCCLTMGLIDKCTCPGIVRIGSSLLQ